MAVTVILADDEEDKLKGWEDYINEYKRETSKSVDLDMVGLGTPIRVKAVNMEEVLNILGTPPSGPGPRVGLIYAHASPEGLIMRITENANWSSTKYLRGISRAWKAIDQIIRLRSGVWPKSGKPTFLIDVPAAKNLFEGLIGDLKAAEDANKDFDKRLGSPNISSRDEADAWFDQWMEMMAKATLGGGLHENDMRRVCRAMQKVRDLKYDRIEIRACNIGRDVENLNALKEFFGAKAVLGPKTTMFFGSLAVNANTQGLPALEKALGGFRGNQFIPPNHKGMSKNDLQMLDKIFKDPDSHQPLPEASTGRHNRFFSLSGADDAVVQLVETSPYEYKGRLWTTSEAGVGQFARANYLASYQFNAGKKKLPVGGMWAPDSSPPFTCPLEAGYRGLIESST